MSVYVGTAGWSYPRGVGKWNDLFYPSHLEELIRRLDAYPLAIELRHRSWSDNGDVAKLFEKFGAAWVMIDEPKFRTSIRDVPLTSRLGYFRFHGRNYEQWWKGDNETRY